MAERKMGGQKESESERGAAWLVRAGELGLGGQFAGDSGAGPGASPGQHQLAQIISGASHQLGKVVRRTNDTTPELWGLIWCRRIASPL